MRLLFIRHGHPNYKLDKLTELGHLQAEAAAERLASEGIDRIYASSCGRAVETAYHTADRIGIPREEVVICPFMREISWGSRDGTPIYEKGSPWAVADKAYREGETLLREDWATAEPFMNNKIGSIVRAVETRGDIWLDFLGFKREGHSYRIMKEDDRTIAMFSHAGSSTALLAHVLGIPFPKLIEVLHPNFTSITEIAFAGKVGEIGAPRIVLGNDARHIRGIEAPPQAPQS